MRIFEKIRSMLSGEYFEKLRREQEKVHAECLKKLSQLNQAYDNLPAFDCLGNETRIVGYVGNEKRERFVSHSTTKNKYMTELMFKVARENDPMAIGLKEAAEIIGVRDRVIRRWIKNGKYKDHLTFYRSGENKNSKLLINKIQVVDFKKNVYKRKTWKMKNGK